MEFEASIDTPPSPRYQNSIDVVASRACLPTARISLDVSSLGRALYNCRRSASEANVRIFGAVLYSQMQQPALLEALTSWELVAAGGCGFGVRCGII